MLLDKYNFAGSWINQNEKQDPDPYNMVPRSSFLHAISLIFWYLDGYATAGLLKEKQSDI